MPRFTAAAQLYGWAWASLSVFPLIWLPPKIPLPDRRDRKEKKARSGRSNPG